MDEKIICYLGPSLPLHRAVELCPNVIFRPPACQGDILSDAVEVMPDRILLVDGNFLQNLSVWVKELVFCLSKEIKVYGAASMGALRAADLWRQGMIGCGKIFEWYKTGVTEDDAEVALLYTHDPKGLYVPLTIPIVDVRATLECYSDVLEINNDHREALLAAAKGIHFRTRNGTALQRVWDPIVGSKVSLFLATNMINQKRFDAELLLANYATLISDAASTSATEKDLSKFFWAQYDRDRRVTVNGVRIAQQHIEAHIALGAVDHHQIFWDSKNFHLAFLLAEKLGVQVNEGDVADEQRRFCFRHGISAMGELENWARDNNYTVGETMVMFVRMATVRRLHHWLASTLVPMESTKITLDYLKMHNSYGYWAKDCAEGEAKLQAANADESMTINCATPIETQLAQHCQKSGQTIDGTVEDFVVETGFSTPYELMVALERLNHLE